MQYFKLPPQAVKLTVTNVPQSLSALIQAANGGTFVDLPNTLTGIDLCNDGLGTIRFLPDGNTPDNTRGIELSGGEIMKFRGADPKKFKFVAPGGNNTLQIQLGTAEDGQMGVILNSRPGAGGGGGAEGALLAANNLGDLTNVAIARTNLQLGSAAVKEAGDAIGEVLEVVDDGAGNAALPAIDGSNLTNVTVDGVLLAANDLSDVNDAATARTNIGAGTGDGDMIAANNLSDLVDAIIARQNLGLGSSATKDAGTGADQVLLLDQNNELPAVVKANTRDGLLVAANDLSDVNDAATARTNLELQDAATKTAGTLNGNVLLLDADNELPADIKANTRDGLLVGANNLSDVADAAEARTNLGIDNLGLGDMLAANNLSDVADVNIARTNLGAGTGDGDMVGANNLSDVADAAVARANIGAGTGDGDLVAANNLNDLADVAVARANLGAGTGDGDMLAANNLNDVADVAISRDNLGLGTGATKDFGSDPGELVILADDGLGGAVLPALDGSRLLNLNIPDVYLTKANNLSDVQDAAQARANIGAGTGDMLVANNLNEVDPAIARTNLELGSAATKDAGDAIGEVLEIVNDGQNNASLPAAIKTNTIDGLLVASNNLSDLTDAAQARDNLGLANLGVGDMLGANNLSELTDEAVARTNLGLGTSATEDVGNAIDNVVQLIDSGDGVTATMPIVDGRNLTNLTIPDVYLTKADNLASVADAATARTNIGAGTGDGDMVAANNLSDVADVEQARTNLGAGTGDGDMLGANNLSDVADAATARANIGAGTGNGDLLAVNNLNDVADVAVARANLGAGTGDGDMLAANNLGDVVDADQARANIGAGTGDGDMLGANNLSDVADVAVARTNLGAGTGDGDLLAANNLNDVADVNVARANLGAGTGDGDMLSANNLDDVADVAVARTNLELGSSATKNAGAAVGEVLEIIDDGLGNPKLPAIDGSALTNLPIPADALLAANNLDDVANVVLARENLGLESAAQKNFGVEIGNLVELQDLGDGVTATLPALDGSNLTNLTIPDVYLTQANNLSDLQDVAVARTNLELGSSALLDAGNAIGEVVVVANDGADNPVLPQVLRDDARSGLLVGANNLSDVADAVIARQNLGLGNVGTGDMLAANNLSDLTDVAVARTNLELGTAATQDVGVEIDNVVQMIDDGAGNSVLPVVNGQNITNLTIPDIYLRKDQNLADVTDADQARANIGAGIGDLLSANNLNDLADPATARDNLQLGTAATRDMGIDPGEAVQLVDDGFGSGALPAVDGSNLTNLTIPDAYLRKNQNLADLQDLPTAQQNLGLGSAATKNTGINIGNVVALENDGTGVATLPAVDGQNVTNLTIPDIYLQKDNNLGDVSNVILARENLELGTAALKNFGTDIGNLVELIDSGDGLTSTLPALDGQNLTNLSGVLYAANDLSDVNDVVTARSNIRADHYDIDESLKFGSDTTRPVTEFKVVQDGDYEIATIQTHRNVEGDPADRNPFIQFGAQDSVYGKINLSYAPGADTDEFQGFAVRSNVESNYLAFLPTFPNKASMSAEYTNSQHRFLSHKNSGGAAWVEFGTAGGTSVVVLNGGRTVNNRIQAYGGAGPNLWLNARDGAAITGGYYEQPLRMYTGVNRSRLCIVDADAVVSNLYSFYCMRNISGARLIQIPKAVQLRVDDVITPVLTIKDETGDCSPNNRIILQGTEPIMGNANYTMDQPFQKVELYFSIQDGEWKTL